MTFTCTSWSLPLLSFEDVIRIMSVLGFRAIDVGAFAGFVHFDPADLAHRPREMAGQLVELGQRNSMAFTDLFVTFGKELADHCVNFPDHGWNAWQGNNQTDVISETVLLKRRLAGFETRA